MECFFHCCDHTHEPIALPDGVAVVVGRKPELKIKCLKCSRNQVQLTADYKEKEVKVKQLGKNPSSIAGLELKRGQTSTLGPGGQICLLHNDYPHFIYFKIQQTQKSLKKSTSIKDHFTDNSSDSKTVSPLKNRKRKIEDSDEDSVVSPKKAKINSIDNYFHPQSNNSKVNIKSNERTIKDSDEDISTLPKKPIIGINDSATEVFPESSIADGCKNDVQTDSKVDEDNSVGTPSSSSTWEEIPGELLVYTRKGVEGRHKIAGFDMDGTLITTKSGRVFPTDTGDWKILLPQIPGKLKSLCSEGYKIVMFTNQNGIAKKKVSIPDFKKKIENVTQALSVPAQVLISPGTGHFRKPSTGMWKHLCEKLNQGITIDKDKSFYIGDAAGRPAGWAAGKKKDFSCSDRSFAANIGIKFQTPEEFFLSKKPAPYNMPEFDPKKLNLNVPLLQPSNASLVSKGKEVIVMVGFPASGKSTFCEEYLVPKGFIRVNRDSLGTWQKCVASCRNNLSQGKSVVVDNTNPDKDSRKRYIDCAKEAKVPVRCFIMNVTKEHAQHNNQVREALNTDKNYKPVGFMVYNSYKSSFVEPSIEEGFSEIIRVQFKPKFKHEDTKELYYQFL